MTISAFENIDIAHYLDQGVLLLDCDGRVRGWNSWLARHSGLNSERVQGQLLCDLFPALLARPAFARLMAGLNSQTPVILSPAIHHYLLPMEATEVQTAKGVEYMYQFVQGQCIALPDQSEGLLVCLSDVTENYLLNSKIQANFKEIRKQNQQLDLARQHTNSFLANMSHELRTPLNSILVLSQLLIENRSNHLDFKELEFAKTINRSGNGLLKLINDVLDLAKVEAGHLDIICELFALDELLKFERDIFEPLAAEKDFTFAIAVATDAPDFLYGDSHRIAQILRNFLSNAFKFTHAGSVELRVERRRHYKRFDDAVIFSVVDTGVGINEQKRADIFEAFKQADGTTNRKYGGTGLGLSISKELAGLLGGVVTLDSTEGQGSHFSLVLPYDQREVDEQRRESGLEMPAPSAHTPKVSAEDLFSGDISPTVEAAQLRNKRVLLISDTIRDIYLLTSTLERLEMEVVSVYKSLEALDRLREQGADIILLDMCSADETLYQSIKNIRSTEEYADLPLFAMIEGGDEVVLDAVDEVFVKPIDLDLLTRMLAQYMV